MLINEKEMGREYFKCMSYTDLNRTYHFHRCFELIFVEEGTLIVESNSGVESIQKDGFALIFPNTLHSFATDQHSKVVITFFSGDLVSPFMNFIKFKRPNSIQFDCKTSVRDFFEREILENIHSKIDWYTRKAVLDAMLGEFRKNVMLSYEGDYNSDVAIRTMRYLEEHYAEDITLAKVSEAIGYEKHYISRCLHRYTSLNFTKILNWLRIDAAMDMLENSDLSIAEISLNSGFQSIRNFNRIFLAMTERTPSEAARSFSRRNNTIESAQEKEELC